MNYLYPFYIFDGSEFVLKNRCTFHGKDREIALWLAKGYSVFPFKGCYFVCCKYENLDKIRIYDNRILF